MKKVLLIHPVVREWAKPCNLPLGTAYVAAALKQAGISYDVIDDNMLRWDDGKIKKFLAENSFEIAGISAIVHQYRQVRRWVALLREVQPTIKIVIGGPISQLGDKLHLWLHNVLVWVGEGEAVFPGHNWTDGETTVYAAPIENLDVLPFPSWGDFDAIGYANNPVGAVNKNKWSDGSPAGPVPRSMNLLASRGCPFNCKFCAHDFMGAKFRTRSVESVLAEMVALHDKYAVRYFHLSDDSTMARPMWLRKLCGAIKKHPKLGQCHWGCAGRVDAADEATLKLMYDSGCRIVGFGVESGSQRMLDAMDKRTTVAENMKAVRNAKKIFGSASYSMMVGTPGEDDESIQESIDFCKATETRPEVIFYLSPLPGSYFYEYALQRGFIKDEEAYLLGLDENARKINCNISGQSDEWLVAAKDRLWEAVKGYGAAI